jgi:hypothetical protein
MVTTISLLFQALKQKEVLMVEDVLTETPSGDHHEIAVDIEVTKIASENLTASEGRDAAETCVILVVWVVAQCDILSTRIFDCFC